MSNRNPHGNQGIFSNDSFMTNRYEEEKVYVDYKPPPSAPAGMNNKRGRVKMFTSLQPRPYKLVGDFLPSSVESPPPVERSDSPDEN